MKNINPLFSFLFVVLLLSCNKKKEEDSIRETQPGVKFYSGLPNSNYGPVSKFYDNTTKSDVWLFGSFNSLGQHKEIKRIVLNKKNDSYFSNYLIDQNGKPYMVYTTDKNGIKDNVILKIDYANSDKIIYNLYKYNWTTKQDSLLMQQEFNISTGTSVFNYKYITNTNYDYWDKAVSELNKLSNNFNLAINGKIIIDNYPNAKISTTHISESLASYIVISVVLLRKIEETKKFKKLAELNTPIELNDFMEAEDQTFVNLINSTNTEIPTPTGTPLKPFGNPSIIGTWKAISSIRCGIDRFLIPANLVANYNTPCGMINMNGYSLCIQDDLRIFNSDMTYVYTEGATSCNPKQQNVNAIYSLNGNLLAVYATTNGYGTSNIEILQLDNSIMKWKTSDDEIITLQRQ